MPRRAGVEHDRTASSTDGTLAAARVAKGRDLVDVDGEADHGQLRFKFKVE